MDVMERVEPAHPRRGLGRRWNAAPARDGGGPQRTGNAGLGRLVQASERPRKDVKGGASGHGAANFTGGGAAACREA